MKSWSRLDEVRVVAIVISAGRRRFTDDLQKEVFDIVLSQEQRESITNENSAAKRTKGQHR